MERTEKLHIVMFPWLAYGHIMPFFEVSKFLAEKGHRITYISTPKIISRLPKLPPNLSSNISLIEFPLPQIHGLPPGVESTGEIPINKVPYLKKAYDKLETPLAEFLKTSNVDWIIHDFLPHWLSGVAAPLGIKLVFFSIFNATLLAFLGPPSALLGDRRKQPEDFTVVPEWIDYPSNVAYKLHELVNHNECMDVDVSDFQRLAQVIRGCHIVTVRSCPELESDEIRLLNKIYRKPVVPMGLMPPPSVPAAPPNEKWETIKKWLDNRREKSVFYAALGTEVSLSQEFMHELAFGIEKSNLAFVWVVRNRPLLEQAAAAARDQDILPPGFEERVSNRGLVLREWAPQVKILAHASVGGFLTHCGWSSIIEGLKFGRALILFSGASSDQGLNARLFHGKKVGLEIERNETDGSFTSELVARTIRRVMVEPQGEAVRANAGAMRQVFDNQDLSNNYLEAFIQHLTPSASEL